MGKSWRAVLSYAVVVTTLGACSSAGSKASSDGGGGAGAGGTITSGSGGSTPSGSGGSTPSGSGGSTARGGQTGTLDAAVDMPPVGSTTSDGAPCPSDVVCPSGLCQSGKCLPRYIWTRLSPVCGQAIAASPGGGVVLASGASVASLDADGNVLWEHTFPPQLASNQSSFGGLGVLSDGSVLVAAGGDLVAFDNGTTIVNSTANIPEFLAKWSASGAYQWIKTFPDPISGVAQTDSIEISSLSVGPSDTVTLAGDYLGLVNFDFDGVAPSTGTDGAGSTNPIIFVAQYSSAGKFAWVQSYPSTREGIASQVTVGPDGAIDLGGAFAGTGPFGSNNPALTASTDFLAHLGPTGSTTASGTWISTTFLGEQFWAMAADGSVVGQSGMALTRVAAATGQPVWSSAGNWGAVRVAAANNFIAWGSYYTGQIDLDLGAAEPGYVAPANASVFLAEYDLTGKLLWLRQPAFASNLATLAPDGSVYYVEGAPTSVSADFDPGPAEDLKPPSGSTSCYLTKFAP